MTVTSGSVTLVKDAQNLIGISIGGGAPHCPCVYVVQLFDNTPASKDGTLASGDEIVGVNGSSVKGRTKVEVARMIQTVKVRLEVYCIAFCEDDGNVCCWYRMNIIGHWWYCNVIEHFCSAPPGSLLRVSGGGDGCGIGVHGCGG